jgi:hypothetical protein
MTVYRFRIAAANDAGQGDFSEIQEFSTCIAQPPSLKGISCVHYILILRTTNACCAISFKLYNAASTKPACRNVITFCPGGHQCQKIPGTSWLPLIVVIALYSGWWKDLWLADCQVLSFLQFLTMGKGSGRWAKVVKSMMKWDLYSTNCQNIWSLMQYNDLVNICSHSH